MSTETLSVNAIENGVVIDHLPAGTALKIMPLLGLNKDHCITLGLNLSSRALSIKDLIKIEGFKLSDQQKAIIALFAPTSKINHIEDHKVAKKENLTPPDEITGVFDCLNPNCITTHQCTPRRFKLVNHGAALQCVYCETSIDREHLRISGHHT